MFGNVYNKQEMYMSVILHFIFIKIYNEQNNTSKYESS